jgi:hypothetical protein
VGRRVAHAAKDGIARWGVIETDWSPYTFTMNWRFTPRITGCASRTSPSLLLPDRARRTRPVRARHNRIEEEEVEGGSTPEKSPTTPRWVTDTQPSAPAEKWQKLYYRGIRPAGGVDRATMSPSCGSSRFECPTSAPWRRGNVRRGRRLQRRACAGLDAAAWRFSAGFRVRPKPKS